MYSITYDEASAVLTVAVDGFWDEATMKAFASELAATMAGLRAQGTAFGVLGDGSRFAVQSREISEKLIELVDAGNAHDRAPTAIFTGSALSKLQASRTMAAPHVRVCQTREEALAWLKDRLGTTR